MNILIYTTSYFDGKVECETLADCKKIIHANPNTNVRVEIDGYRLLLEPCQADGSRKIDGFSDLSLTYKYFNNLTEDGLSHITVGERGVPGEIYISNIR